MKSASLKEIKAELGTLHHAQLFEICLRLAKFKKDNKELLYYLLYDAQDEAAYIDKVKSMITEGFLNINKSNLYLVKKMVRKVLRTTNKYIRYSGSGQTEVELLICFCREMKSLGVPLKDNTVLGNLFQAQIRRINKALSALHEDLQYDYKNEITRLGLLSALHL